MRPRKRILLVDADEDRQAATRFMLQTNGYHVISAAAPQKDSLEEHPELILGYWPVAPDAFTKLTKAAGVPSIVAAGVKDRPSMFLADAVLLNPATDVLLAHIRVMSHRKRGPKKGFNRKPVLSETSQPQQVAVSS